MRNIDPDILSQMVGLEPINIIEVHWTNTNVKLYCDKTTKEAEGRITSLSNLNDVLRLDSSGSSGSLSITLSDLDGALKTIYDSTDIHLRTVKVYQQFGDSAKFLLFEGGIASPVVWDEGQRTLSFDVINRILDTDVGFAPYDGQFGNVPAEMVGKAWPMPFGYVQTYPTLPIQPVPSGILIDSFGIPDKGIPEQVWRLGEQAAALKPSVQGTVLKTGATLDEFNTALRNDALALDQALAEIAKQKKEINDQIFALMQTFSLQQNYFRTTVKVYSITLPNGSFLFMINDTFFKATFARIDAFTGILTLNIDINWSGPDINFILDDLGFPRFGRPGALQYGFRFFPPGTAFTIVKDYPLRHIASAIHGQVRGVYAYRNYNGIRQLSLLPEEYYTIQYGLSGDGFPGEAVTISGSVPNAESGASWLSPVVIVLNAPLNMAQYIRQLENMDLTFAPTIGNLDQIYAGYNTIGRTFNFDGNVIPRETWEDDIYVTFQSSVGPHPLNIVEWCISTFSNLQYNHPSFAVDDFDLFKMNFVLMEKKPLTQLLNEIAVHLCAYIYIENEEFFIRNLAIEPDSVDTITEDDIIENSLQLQCTETENLVTKYIGTYLPVHLPDVQSSKIVLFNNVNRYGIKVEEFNYYGFDNYLKVLRSSTFWLIRKSNTWKRIVFKTPLSKLNIESMDCVTLDFTLIKIANGPVKGLVESAIYDSQDSTIEMTIWLPVRLGELTPYPPFWPSGLTIEQVTLYYQSIFSGSGAVTPNTQYTPFSFPNPPTMPGINIGANLQDLTKRFTNNAFVNQQIIVSGWSDEGEYHEMSMTQAEFKERFGEIWKPGTLFAGDPTDPSSWVDSAGNNNAIFHPLSILVGRQPVIPGPGVSPGFDYKLKDYVPRPPLILTNQKGSVFPGKVKSGSSTDYIVTIYPQGLDGDGQDVNAKQLQIDPDDTIDVGTSIMVSMVLDKDNNKTYYMQVPVWED